MSSTPRYVAGRKNSSDGANGRGEERGPRARMQRTLLATAMDLMQGGLIPSVSDVAEAAGVSRATAYRYFPSQAAMIQAASEEALRPVFGWKNDDGSATERLEALITFAYPHIDAYEATHRATLLMALDQWARGRAGTLGDEPPIVRGNRRRLLSEAAKPLREHLGKAGFTRLTQALSLLFGTEAFVVLKDIWELDRESAQSVALWAARALVTAAEAEAAQSKAAIAKPARRAKTTTGSKEKLNKDK